MESATLLLQSNFTAPRALTTRAVVPFRRRQDSRVFSVLRNPPATDNASKFAQHERIPIADHDPAGHINNSSSSASTGYQDSWFHLLATNHLSQSVQFASGIRNKKRGYENLVEAATAVYKNYNPILQRELVILALQRAFPRPILALIRTVMPNSRFTREFFAAFTTVFFAWLVGACEVKESEVNGRRERNVVNIKKCRFLEESNCVGMCLNLCKVPSQTFIKDFLGMPVNMVPNFDDMSCEMVFGEEPLKPEDDPAFKQSCFKQCKVKQKHTTNCINQYNKKMEADHNKCT
ncbi:hypothetical protein SAY86_022251 [Trapa natans]|uniref:Beta-carotene isomerase D27-like C-terminal domain-containing protein n=1 Tax=Trapa natans TaxID=22666 RepID=A0AAN7MB33_TRANT|nr:hypothetical protein SAY86_022251 [Trapa natans]